MDHKNFNDPTYLRSINDGLSAGLINKDNATALPIGLVGVYEEALPPASNVNERKKFLEFFAAWAILKKEVSADFVLPLLEGWTEEELVDFIGRYSKWFNCPESGKYIIYHERFRSFLLSKLTETEFYTLNQKIINHIESSIYSQDSFENELYGLEFLSLHVKLQFHWRKDESLIVKLKEISETDFLKRQVKISKKFKWTNNFWTDLIYMAEFIDDVNKYRYYYDLFNSFLDEDNYINEVMQSIEDYDISVILETIEKLEFESLYDKKKQLSICLNCILSLLQDSEPQIDKIVVLCRKLEDVIDAICFEHEDERINFLPLTLIILSGAKLHSLEIETTFPDKLMHLNFYTPYSIDYANLLAKVKLNKAELINYVNSVMNSIKLVFEKSGFILFDYEENNQEDPQYELDKIYQLYKVLKYLIIDYFDVNDDHLNYFNIVLDLLHRVNEKAAEDYISKLPSELQADMVELIYNKLEELDYFKACLFVSKHFLLFDGHKIFKTIDLILDTPKYGPTNTIFLLNNCDKLDKGKLNSYFDNYYSFVEGQEFNVTVIIELIQNCFVLHDLGYFELIKKINQCFEDELDRLIDLYVGLSSDLLILRDLDSPRFVEKFNFGQIKSLSRETLFFIGMNFRNKLASRMLELDIEDLRAQHAIKNDWDATLELQICELACKLGITDWLVNFVPELYIDYKIDLFFEFRGQIKNFDFESQIAILNSFKKQNFAYSNPSEEQLEINLFVNTSIMEVKISKEKFSFYTMERRKKAIYNYDQFKYLYQIAKVHLANEDIQTAVDILPYVGNYYKVLMFDIGFAFLELERDFNSFISLIKDMIAYHDEEFGEGHNSFDNFKLDLKYGIERLEKIILHASNDSISSKKLNQSLVLLFTSKSLLNIDDLIKIQNFKIINSDYLNKLIIQIVKSNSIDVFHRIYILMSLQANKWINKELVKFFKTEVYKEAPDERNIKNLITLTESIKKAEKLSKLDIEEIWHQYINSMKHSYMKLLLLGLLPLNALVEKDIIECIKKVNKINLESKAQDVLSLFHDYKDNFQFMPLKTFAEKILIKYKYSVFNAFDEDTGEGFELVSVEAINGDDAFELGKTIQLTAESYGKLGLWVSENPQVAVVDGNGLLTAVGVGKAKITYTVKATLSDSTDSSYKIIKVLNDEEIEAKAAKDFVNLELSKNADKINFSPILFRSINNKKIFSQIIDMHAVYRSVFPDEYTGYQEISQELIDLSWLNDNQ